MTVIPKDAQGTPIPQTVPSQNNAERNFVPHLRRSESPVKEGRQRQLWLALPFPGPGQLKHQQCSLTPLGTEETLRALPWLSTALSCTTPPLWPVPSLSHLPHASMSPFHTHASRTQAFWKQFYGHLSQYLGWENSPLPGTPLCYSGPFTLAWAAK